MLKILYVNVLKHLKFQLRWLFRNWKLFDFFVRYTGQSEALPMLSLSSAKQCHGSNDNYHKYSTIPIYSFIKSHEVLLKCPQIEVSCALLIIGVCSIPICTSARTQEIWIKVKCRKIIDLPSVDWQDFYWTRPEPGTWQEVAQPSILGPRALAFLLVSWLTKEEGFSTPSLYNSFIIITNTTELQSSHFIAYLAI